MIFPDPKSNHILLVDDEEAIRRNFRSYLEDMGFRVTEASDGHEGFVCFQREPANLVLTDLRMGRLNGLEFVAAVKSISPDTPVIIVSGTGTVHDAIEAIRRGASDYIVKPVQEMQELEMVIQRTLERQRLIFENRAYRSNLEELVQQRTRELHRLTRAIEQSPASVVITDGEAKIDYVNSKFCEISGYSRAELMGQNPRLLKSGHTPPEQYKEMWNVITGGGEWRGIFRNKKKNGDLYWEYAIISPIKDETGHITHFLGAKEDITESRKAQEKIREQAALLDIAHDAILVLDLEDRLKYFNRAAEVLYGWSQEEMIDQPIDPLILQSCSLRWVAAQKEVRETDFWSGELEQFVKDSQKIVVRSSWTLVRDGQGQPKGILVVNTEITEQKAMERQLLQMQRVECVGRLANGVAHDLNNVLTPILMASDLLRVDEQLSPDAKEGFELILASAQRGADIVKRLLLYSRGMEANRSVLDPRNLIQETVRMIRETFPKSIDIRVNLSAPLWPVEADATQIHQVLLNLCLNARDAMAAGGRLQLHAENIEVDHIHHWSNPEAKAGPFVALKVADSGTGIPPEITDKIFDPFFTTKQYGQGTGLGLSTVLGIVRSHGGFLEVYSQPGQGSQFSVYLPARKEASPFEKPADLATIPRGNGEVILIVDDEEILRRMLHQMLRNHGYQAVTASNGFEALAAYVQHKQQIKAIILDMWMPFMDGLTTIQELEKLNPSAVVIATSGLRSFEDNILMTNPIVKSFIPKPWTPEQLIRVLDQVIHPVSDPIL